MLISKITLSLYINCIKVEEQFLVAIATRRGRVVKLNQAWHVADMWEMMAKILQA